MHSSELRTDQLRTDVTIGRDFASHTRVNHKAGQYVHPGAGTNEAENFSMKPGLVSENRTATVDPNASEA